jgi:hypothetical protein
MMDYDDPLNPAATALIERPGSIAEVSDSEPTQRWCYNRCQ